jgi:DNA repair protein SbcD/Mre11
MRLIHTSDWHLGRRLKGLDRTPEIEYQLDELFLAAKILEVDAVLVAGDIFDGPSPPADAEKVAYRFFCQLREANIPAVIIAGNHDSAFRIEGISQLLSHIGISALGRPKKANQGGVIQIETQNGKLCVAAMPFASERRLLKAEDLWEKDELEQRQHYKQTVAYLFNNLASGFREDSINVVMAHLTIEGAKRAYSEVDYYTRDTYSLVGQTLPPEAQYIALGHIHKPQQIPNAAPTYYSGSLIQVDFGEAGEDKGFNLVTIEPGSPAQVEFKPLPCPNPLKVINCNESNLEETLETNQKHPGFLKVIIELNGPQMGLADQVRKICPQTLMIEAKYLKIKEEKPKEAPAPNQFDAVLEFQRYWNEREETLKPAVLQAFEELHQEISNQ